MKVLALFSLLVMSVCAYGETTQSTLKAGSNWRS